jgi:hypothetical protein
VDCIIKINGRKSAHKITILINTTASRHLTRVGRGHIIKINGKEEAHKITILISIT